MQSGNLAQSADCTVQSADCTVAVQSADCMPCSLQTARQPFQGRVLHCTCLLVLLEYHTDLPALLELHVRVCFGEITSKETERIVMIL